MISDLFYLSTLLEQSLALNEYEKELVYISAFHDSRKTTQYIKYIESELSELREIKENNKKSICQLNCSTEQKIDLIEEVNYGKKIKEQIDLIKQEELIDSQL